MNKILVKLYVPMIEGQYDIWIPTGRKVYSVIMLLVKAINDLNNGNYEPNQMPVLYDKLTAKPFDMDARVRETEMKNGMELVLI